MKHMQDCYTLQNGVLIPRMVTVLPLSARR